jgi:tetratricopeptide (TPR) repeat protein
LSAGHTDVAVRLLDKADAVPGLSRDAPARYALLSARGKLCVLQSRWAEAEGWYREALALAERTGHRRWQGGLWGNLGMVASAMGRREDARDRWKASQRFAADIGDRQWAGNTHCNLGLLLHELGEHEAARLELQAALAIARELGHRQLEATALCNLGFMAESEGQLAEARDKLASSADLASALGDARLEASARGYLALALAGVGAHAQAAQALACAEALLAGREDQAAQDLLALQMMLVAAAAGQLDRIKARWTNSGPDLALAELSGAPEVGALAARVRRIVTNEAE